MVDAESDGVAPRLRGLRCREGFALYVAVADAEETAHHVKTMLREHLPCPTVSIGCAEIDWSVSGRPLDDILKARLADALPEAVAFLWHLDAHVGEEPRGGEGTQTLFAEMNWRRGFYARLARPLVIWLPENAARRFAPGAPDLFDRNSGHYVFGTPVEEVIQIQRRNGIEMRVSLARDKSKAGSSIRLIGPVVHVGCHLDHFGNRI